MGELRRIRTELVRPTQKAFDTNKLWFHLDFYLEHDNFILPPAVREMNGVYLILDGHHRMLITNLARANKVCVYVAKQKDDLMLKEEFGDPPRTNAVGQPYSAREWQNEVIRARFENIASQAKMLKSSGIETFTDLRGQIPSSLIFDYYYIKAKQKIKKLVDFAR